MPDADRPATTPPAPPPAPPPLLEGWWAWCYPERSPWWPFPGWPDVHKVASELLALGFTGVIPQNGLATRAWLTDERIRVFTDAGLKVCYGVGSIAPKSPERCAKIANAIITGLRTPGVVGTMFDWEGSYDGRQAEAKTIVARVLDAVPDAPARVADCPWYAPLFLIGRDGKQHPTHPSAPTEILGRLCKGGRWVQAYGADVKGSPDGASERMYRWACSPTQYPALGTPADRVFPGLQTYGRSLQDHVETTLRHPHIAFWNFTDWSPEFRNGLAVVRALRAHGFDGDGAVAHFQAAEGLAADGIVGPRTLAALGLPPPRP